MSDKIIGILIIAIGILTAIGFLPVNIGTPRSYRYWKPMNTIPSILNRLGGASFCINMGILWAWSATMSQICCSIFTVIALTSLLLGVIGFVLGRNSDSNSSS